MNRQPEVSRLPFAPEIAFCSVHAETAIAALQIRPEVYPFLAGTACAALIIYAGLRVAGVEARRTRQVSILSALVLGMFFVFFFRDPERVPPTDEALIVAGADGRVTSVTTFKANDFIEVMQRPGITPDRISRLCGRDVVRISIFLSPFDVHVNRAPISGDAMFLGYFPGKRLLTITEKSSTLNQHNSILIEGKTTVCLVNQIVGPICRRVVYWHDKSVRVRIARGERIGMMKFGSRLDMYLPASDIEVLARPGSRVAAGVTPVARLKSENA